jgi:hypothetical protein
MGTLGDLDKLIKQKDIRINDLERQLQEKEDLILELRSQLDKYQCILPRSPSLRNGPKTQRTQGISAEPQGLFGGRRGSELQENEKFAKTQR